MPRSQRKRLFRTVLACVMVLSSVIGLAGFGTAQAQPSAQNPSSGPGSPNGLVINEVFDSQNVASEYFELYNTSAITIDLTTYRIYNHDGNTPLSNLDNPQLG